MSGKNKSKRRLKRLASVSLIGAACCTTGAFAQSDPATAPPPDSKKQLDKITITGSNIRRTDTETPSPLQTITAEDLKKSGYTSISDVLHNITANNMGSLTQANPAAFGAGGSGVSLRGLTVGGTLVLINGHRMAPYPMPDDGERNFVDISSIPFDAIERIEILKDGASSIYGSDAIAGVVNVILKRSVVGTTISAEHGVSTKHDGKMDHASVSSGWGDLDADGYNAYIAAEFRHQDPISLTRRPYLGITDWTPYGGVDLTQGVNNPIYVGLPGSINGYLVDPANPYGPNNTTAPIATYGNCNAAALAANQCGYVNKQLQIQPRTQNIDVLGRFSKKLEGDWQMNLQGSILQSDATQVGVYNATGPLGFFGLTSLNFGPKVNPPQPYDANNFPYVITVPANYPGNPLGAPAGLIYNFPDVGAQTQTTSTTSYRFVAELNGSFAGWDLENSFGLTHVETKLTSRNFISISGLQNALNAGTYLVGGNNSSAVLSSIAPNASSKSTSDLDFLTLRASRDLMPLPGGQLAAGFGFDFTHRALDEEFPSSFASGDQVSPIYSYAVGDQNTTAVYGELVAPVLKNLELDASARLDYYTRFGSNTTPKLGFKYTPVPEWTLRGTYSRGFRAPNVAESGNAGSTSGVLNAATNPATGQLIFVPNIQLSNPDLKPEKSTSYTLGTIFEPNHSIYMSLDYYDITIKDQIISVGQLGENQYLYPDLYGVKFYPNLQNIAYDTYPFINASKTRTNGVDLDLVGKMDLGGYGKLRAELQFTRMFKYDVSLPQLGTFALAGTHGPSFVSGDTGTPQNRAALTFGWSRGPLDVTTTVNYVSSYGVTDPSYGIDTCADALVSQFNGATPPAQFCRVPSFTTVNLNARYQYNKQIELHGSITNLFDRKAPYDLQTFGSAGNGAGTGGAPYNPALAQDGAIGRYVTVGARYSF